MFTLVHYMCILKSITPFGMRREGEKCRKEEEECLTIYCTLFAIVN